jgi:hypothetical protein
MMIGRGGNGVKWERAIWLMGKMAKGELGKKMGKMGNGFGQNGKTPARHVSVDGQFGWRPASNDNPEQGQLSME